MENRGICFGNWGYGKYDEFGEYIYIFFFFRYFFLRASLYLIHRSRDKKQSTVSGEYQFISYILVKFICPEPITLLIRPIIFFVLSPLLSPIPTGIKYVRRLDILFETVTISLKRYIPGRVHSRIIWEGKGKLYFKINFLLKFKEVREINSVPLYQLFYY